MTDITQLDTTSLIELVKPEQVTEKTHPAVAFGYDAEYEHGASPMTNGKEHWYRFKDQASAHAAKKKYPGAQLRQANKDGTHDLYHPLHEDLEEGDNGTEVIEQDDLSEAIVIQPIEDLPDLFEVVQGQEDISEGETIDIVQLEKLRDLGYIVVEQSLEEANYHVHAEVSPKGIPLTHTHVIPVTARNSIEARARARAHVKERGWKIHHIYKSVLAENAYQPVSYNSLIAELDKEPKLAKVEFGELPNQNEGPNTFTEITAPQLDSLNESVGTKVHHFDDFKANVQDHADHTTSHGKVNYQHEIVGSGKNKWHQTIATVEDRDGNNYIRGVFNHKHGKNSPHGHGWTSSPHGDDD